MSKINLSKVSDLLDTLKNSDPDLDIRDEHASIHAANAFIKFISSPRSYMMGQHFGQSVPIMFGDEKITQTGLEKQLGENTFSKTIEKDSYVHKVISRYESISSDAVDYEVEKLFIIEDIETGVLDYISVPTYFAAHQEFGFEYKKNEELIESIRPGTSVAAGTILADSPTKTKNHGYKFGANLNIALITMNSTAEDGVVLSESAADKLAYTCYEKKVVEYGGDSYPLNTYGDENNYKPFPNIGEKINQDGIVMALRKYDDVLSPALTSRKDVMRVNSNFDKRICVRGPGDDIVVNGESLTTSTVVDIKVYKCPKYKKDVYKGTADVVDKYAESLKRFNEGIIKCYEELVKRHYSKFGNNDLPVSEKLHRLIIEAYAIVNSNNKNRISYTFKNDPIDLYRIEFVIKHVIVPKYPGYKISDLFGSKGVIVQVRKPEEMPYIKSDDGQLIRADIVMDPGSIISRMNPGRLYEQYFNGSSRRCQFLLRKAMNYPKLKSKYTKEEIDTGWNILLDFLSIFETEQIEEYRKLTDVKDKMEVLLDCLEREVFIYYKLSSKKETYRIVADLENSPYAPVKGKAHMIENGVIKTSKKDVMIAPVYTILLAKTADAFLSVASANINHYNIPVKVSSNSDKHYKNSGTKILSETETRLFVSYAGREFLAEIKDRCTSIESHKYMYLTILNADQPSNMEVFIHRDKCPFGGDKSVELLENIFNAGGIKIEFVDE